MSKFLKLVSMKNVFLVVFIILTSYFLIIKTVLYESSATLLVRDLSSKSDASLGLSLLSGSSSTQLQDSMIIEQYLLSHDVFSLLDQEFKLTEHYKSDSLDIIQRATQNATIEDILEFYHSRILITYDEVSGLLKVSYSHSSSKKAQDILEFLLKKVEFDLNEFNRRKAKKQLEFIMLEHKKNKTNMDLSSKKLELYQNTHYLLDPTNEATSITSIVANLESTLTQKKIDLSTKKSYLNSNNYEVVSLKREIKEIEKSIKATKDVLTGKGSEKLNKFLFEYETLKMQFDFDIQVYTASLLQVETTKLEALKEAKTLSILSKPNLPDGYTYPNKPRVFITILITLLLFYGIFSMLLTIIKDHNE